MAVIQDLPPELLRRILELLADDEYAGGDKLLCDVLGWTSLVARAWRHPSQSLLVYNLELSGTGLVRYLAALRANVGCTLREVDLFSDKAPAMLKALAEHQILVEDLGVYAVRRSHLDMSAMRIELLAGLKRLHLARRIGGHPSIPQDTKLQLTTLSIHPECWPSLALLDSILAAAPFLTSLDLKVRADGDLFPQGYVTHVEAIAPRLRHLSISTEYSWTESTSRASPVVIGFVASCTSLVCLELWNCGPPFIEDVISVLRAPLAALTTVLAWNSSRDGLVAILELPMSSELRRWKMDELASYHVILGLAEIDRTEWEVSLPRSRS